MKFKTIVLAAALAFGGAAAIAMPADTGMRTHKTHVKHHVMKHHGKVHHVAMVRHHHVKHAGRHHPAHMASISRHDAYAPMTNASREERMQQSLQKFRSNHG